MRMMKCESFWNQVRLSPTLKISHSPVIAMPMPIPVETTTAVTLSSSSIMTSMYDARISEKESANPRIMQAESDRQKGKKNNYFVLDVMCLTNCICKTLPGKSLVDTRAGGRIIGRKHAAPTRVDIISLIRRCILPQRGRFCMGTRSLAA